ncbi:hypothetical protein VTN00DRAFT_2871 [Thermoascus crustaceus]
MGDYLPKGWAIRTSNNG